MTPSSPSKTVPAKKAAVSSGRSTRRAGSTARSAPVHEAVAPTWALGGDVLTTATGTPVDDTDNSLRLGSRGPTLLDDFHLREKIMHFDHERIPERVVHARGTAAHGHFRLTKSLGHVTKAAVLADIGPDVPVFVRFSTVAGSRGSADTARDVRGFAVRFYTEEGNWDLVGNNMPVFFIQDGIKFPDLIHAAKPEPDKEIPQAQTAHDTFWDFASLTPETAHMLMWVMSDRAIPRSFRTMEGFGVHTFRLVNSKGATTLVKFHWKPRAGMHSLVWEEAQKLGGIDPDFHRRDLWEAIDAGNFPEWDLGVQLMKDTDDQMFEGIDLLDPTKLVPEELVPVTIVGTLTLDRNPDNFFAETEQVAFCTTHVPPGVDFTDDPLLQARNFSYLDTQLTRLGGPNFDQLPINRPRAAVNTTQRDGYGQAAVHPGRAAYTPNSIGGGCPYTAGESAWVAVPRSMDGIRARARAESFGDHFSQATMFWESMSPPEREHIVGAFSFELSKCEQPEIRERVLGILANIDSVLVSEVAAHLGLKAPKGRPSGDVVPSPALSMRQLGGGSIAGRLVGVLVEAGADVAGIKALRAALTAQGANLCVIAPHVGTVNWPSGSLTADRAVFSTQSVEYDALVVAGGTGASTLALQPYTALNLSEAYRHHKVVAAWGDAQVALANAGIDSDASGVVRANKADKAFVESFVTALSWHRHWSR